MKFEKISFKEFLEEIGAVVNENNVDGYIKKMPDGNEIYFNRVSKQEHSFSYGGGGVDIHYFEFDTIIRIDYGMELVHFILEQEKGGGGKVELCFRRVGLQSRNLVSELINGVGKMEKIKGKTNNG